jgi:hypothetical protein
MTSAGILNYYFANPKKSTNYFVVAPNRPVKFELNNVTILHFHKTTLKNKSQSSSTSYGDDTPNDSYILQIHSSISCQNSLLKEMEQKTVSEMLEKNKEWFNNNLSNEDILDSHEPAFNEQSNILKLFLVNESNTGLMYKTTKKQTLKDLISIFDPKKHTMDMVVKLNGLYIYKDRFCNKFCVEQIIINDLPKMLDVKEEVETLIQVDIDELKHKIDEKAQQLMTEHVTNLKNLESKREEIKKIETEFENIKSQKLEENLWNEKMTNIQKSILQNSFY